MDEKYVFSGLERDLIPRMYIYMKKKLNTKTVWPLQRCRWRIILSKLVARVRVPK